MKEQRRVSVCAARSKTGIGRTTTNTSARRPSVSPPYWLRAGKTRGQTGTWQRCRAKTSERVLRNGSEIACAKRSTCTKVPSGKTILDIMDSKSCREGQGVMGVHEFRHGRLQHQTKLQDCAPPRSRPEWRLLTQGGQRNLGPRRYRGSWDLEPLTGSMNGIRSR